MSSEQQYIDLYAECAELVKGKSCGVMNAVRDEAFEAFRRMGFPSRKVERYKYTDVAAAFAPNYGLSLAPLDIKPSPFISSLSAAAAAGNPAASLYATVADMSDPITALNTALVHDTLLIYVPRNTRAADPIQIDYTLRGNCDTMMNRRVLIVMEQGSEATVIINDKAAPAVPTAPTVSGGFASDAPAGLPAVPGGFAAGPSAGPSAGFPSFLTTQVVEVVCRDNSRLNIYEIEDTAPQCHRFSNVYIREGRDCAVAHNSITLFNGQTRNLCDVYLTGENSEATLNGAVIADSDQRVDNNTLIHHQVPHCLSSELYKYVLDGNAVGAFAGKILVDKDAQKTASQETNANLCASPDARMYTQPMLEIYADDVKCAHGSTVGVMDERALFYMRQRGIPEAEARTLLKNAFMGQVIDQIPLQPLRDKLYVKVEKRFRGQMEKCTACQLCK